MHAMVAQDGGERARFVGLARLNGLRVQLARQFRREVGTQEVPHKVVVSVCGSDRDLEVVLDALPHRRDGLGGQDTAAVVTAGSSGKVGVGGGDRQQQGEGSEPKCEVPLTGRRKAEEERTSTPSSACDRSRRCRGFSSARTAPRWSLVPPRPRTRVAPPPGGPRPKPPSASSSSLLVSLCPPFAFPFARAAIDRDRSINSCPFRDSTLAVNSDCVRQSEVSLFSLGGGLGGVAEAAGGRWGGGQTKRMDREKTTTTP